MRSGGAHRRIFWPLIPTVEVRGTGVDQGNGVAEMTAVVCRERARTTYLTAAAGMLMLAAAFMMMIVAAPGHLPARTHGPVKPSAVRLTTDVCRQFAPAGGQAATHGCLAGPPLAN